MPRAKKNISADAPTAATPSPTPDRQFQSRKPLERGNALTHDRISEHIDAFRKAGGTIEVLGTTMSLQRIGSHAEAAPAADTPPSPRKRKR